MKNLGLLVFFLLSFRWTVAQEDEIMVTNGVQHSVPLETIIFDDFDSLTRALPYPQATEADIERLRDRIRPFCYGEIAECLLPEYETVAETDTWLSDVSLVMGLVAEDEQAYAYPFKILNFHEIVNETLADEPLLISFCPLCNSAIVYSRIIGGEELVFGNTSALHESDMVMYDTETGSYWFQAGGEAILGELTTSTLTAVPSIVTTWDEWKAQYPDTLILSRPNTGVDYSQDVFARYSAFVNQGNFAFPVSESVSSDTRLRLAENVLVVDIEDESVAFPLVRLNNVAVNTTVGGEVVVVLTKDDSVSAIAFSAQLSEDVVVELEYVDGQWRDTMSDTVFDYSGRAIGGEYEGQTLTQLPTRFMFWFSAVSTTPDIVVYEVDA